MATTSDQDALQEELIRAAAQQDAQALDQAIRSGASVAWHDYAILSVAANSGDLIPDPTKVDPKRRAILERLLDEIMGRPRTAEAVLAWAGSIANDTVPVTLKRLPPAELAAPRAE